MRETAMVVLPNGDVVVGEIEALYRRSESNYEVVIDGETYCVHSTDFAIISRRLKSYFKRGKIDVSE